MLGAIIGDIAGSRFEFIEEKFKRPKEFAFFMPSCSATDDSLMTLAVAEALILSKGDPEVLKAKVVSSMQKIGRRHPDTGWGERFYQWLFSSYPQPYNSYGNGAGMRISPVGWVADSEEEVKLLSKIVTEVTHNHPEGLKGAEAIAMAVYLARIGKSKDYIRERMIEYYPRLSDKSFTIQKIHGFYGYDDEGMWVTCQGSIPEALIAFLDSNSFEDAVRNAICIGGDSDTIGAMAGSIAEAYYGVSYELEDAALEYLTEDLISIYYAFETIKKKRTKRE